MFEESPVNAVPEAEEIQLFSSISEEEKSDEVGIVGEKGTKREKEQKKEKRKSISLLEALLAWDGNPGQTM
ncbi:hypothetical protein Patl1_03810 [Pistacia atlantica]|uniref:Uncharacterized protein n=1 Tax=Pistacia atlantica TaxID=434234 RepID=A0ACC1BW73_9ROSI|nr:hypothetical protein Patl1_03810 [Pistacia atlantica]